MCEVCGCGDPTIIKLKAASLRPQGAAPAEPHAAKPEAGAIAVHASLLAGNDAAAQALRARFVAQGVTVLNLMGSPGSGKTALLEATARGLGPAVTLSGVSGDLATALDADRMARAGIVSAPITTGSACHLDAAMVAAALALAPLNEAVPRSDVFFIENVGNLVCPAIYDLGQHRNVVALSVTEGVDKPLKYPVMFRHADLVVLTKVDLLPYLPEVSVHAIRQALATVMPRPALLPVSARTGEGLDAWLAWLARERQDVGAMRSSTSTRT